MKYFKVRCKKCLRVLLEEDLPTAQGTIKKKCERCGEMNYIDFDRMVDKSDSGWYSQVKTK